ncbi:MAG TPA: division/cell wall cluster transcriptional repressor MraZ [Bacillota bacterium]|nr:division/cell wall cluster transcriptional repressor MraZ [Bacillota bacterium]
MFLGEYTYSLDAKARMFVPASFREELGNEFILCKGIENTLRLYPKSSWDEFVEKLRALPDTEAMAVKLFFFSSAREASLDSQGRLLIPQAYREHAGIDKDVCVLGNYNRVELWSVAAWESFRKDSDLRERMIKLGV